MFFKICPECGHEDTPTQRSAPKFVDGDLDELDLDVLEMMREKVAAVDEPVEDFTKRLISRRVPDIGRPRLQKLHVKNQEAQTILRDRLAWWAGHGRAQGFNDSELYRKFYITYGVDVLSAQSLGTKDAEKLTEKINQEIGAPV